MFLLWKAEGSMSEGERIVQSLIQTINLSDGDECYLAGLETGVLIQMKKMGYPPEHSEEIFAKARAYSYFPRSRPFDHWQQPSSL